MFFLSNWHYKFAVAKAQFPYNKPTVTFEAVLRYQHLR